MEIILKTILTGIGATIIMDIWAWLLRKLFKVQGLNYAFLGRWIGHLFKGKFNHHPIMASEPIPGELALGWMAHYGIGITFSILLVMLWGPEWLASPQILPALIIGIGTTVAPFFLMQPAMGMGIAAARTPKPAIARLKSLMTHTIYGIGLYLAAQLLTFLP
ncbi:Protein of unknown function (DUF2938) [Chitinophaga dinghuensis]|uniref:DUF2938 family protein n=1 Tax=Chitinophaga dinghuensis TaxID=1539050 RepID=A0A327W7W0_9BACT|nr:DUF2938 domain-containing protein [Chitinophaga dinghuensis]RAJ82118.1 Protein of unknown function (DUF2938) [Chitinophaga dinghuensis]